MLNKENKKIMEVFFVHRQQGSQFPLSIYILTVQYVVTQIIFFGVRGSWHTPPDVKLEVWEPFPKAQTKDSKLAYYGFNPFESLY